MFKGIVQDIIAPVPHTYPLVTRENLLASKELLRRRAPLTLAAGASQAVLVRAEESTGKMLLGEVGQGLDEDGIAVQTLHALDRVGVSRLADDLLVELVKGFDVIGSEGNRNQYEVLLALVDVLLNRGLGLGTEPWLRADLRLIAESVGVGEVETLHDRLNRRANLLGVRVT